MGVESIPFRWGQFVPAGGLCDDSRKVVGVGLHIGKSDIVLRSTQGNLSSGHLGVLPNFESQKNDARKDSQVGAN